MFEDSAYILVSYCAEVSFCCKKIYHLTNVNLQPGLRLPLSYSFCCLAANGKIICGSDSSGLMLSSLCSQSSGLLIQAAAAAKWETATTQSIFFYFFFLNQVRLNKLDANAMTFGSEID